MRKIFITIGIGLILTLASCGWLETSDNGDLDGYWHVEEIDTLSTGGVCDMSDQTLFWGVQGHLVYYYNSRVGASYFSHFTQNDTILHLYDIHRYDREGGDSLVTNAALLNGFGLHSLDTQFRIERLTGGKMTLSDDSFRIKFKKF